MWGGTVKEADMQHVGEGDMHPISEPIYVVGEIIPLYRACCAACGRLSEVARPGDRLTKRMVLDYLRESGWTYGPDKR